MTTLHDLIARQIESEGPLKVSDYMDVCLLHPEHGYYAKQDPFGRTGDFVTAPEVSQMFGELIGLWAAQCWLSMGQPAGINIAELGPGRGSLQADFQRAIKKALPDMWQECQVHLIEASPALVQVQKNTLDASTYVEPLWHDNLAKVPDGPTLVIANEFLDALPIDQYIFCNGAWRQRLIGMQDSDLSFVVGEEVSLDAIPADLKDQAQEGDIWEENPAAEQAITTIASKLTKHSGYTLFIDYGHSQSGFGDTFQGVRDHAYADVLSSPGDVDLTAHVDFEHVTRKAEESGLAVSPIATQGDFLQTLGIAARAETLKRSASPSQSREIDTALQRLTAPGQMGRLFKVACLRSIDLPSPPGFMAG